MPAEPCQLGLRKASDKQTLKIVKNDIGNSTFCCYRREPFWRKDLLQEYKLY